MKQVLRGMGKEGRAGGGTESKCKIEEEQEEINYLSPCGLYGELLLLVVKMDLGPEKYLLLGSWFYLSKHRLFFQ